MEQQAVIRFLTLKGLHAVAIVAELRCVYKEDALALATAKSCASASWKGELRCAITQGLEGRFQLIWPKQSHLC
jgi:hypothetical protein